MTAVDGHEEDFEEYVVEEGSQPNIQPTAGPPPAADPLPPNDARPIPASRAVVVARRRSMLETRFAPGMLATTAARSGMATVQQLDSFRQLRTNLQAMATAQGLTHFTTLVVPISSGAGASFIARNLAAAITLQEDRTAVLVDCHMRRPSQHIALGIPESVLGLFDYLEQAEWTGDGLVRPTGVPSLHVIPAGRPRLVPREYFSSHRMRGLLTSLRHEPCDIVLDGPPTTGSPDARILSELADFIVIVTGYGRDTAQAITQAAAMFEPSKFAGVVFNERPTEA